MAFECTLFGFYCNAVLEELSEMRVKFDSMLARGSTF
jgi:hypothetical protein